MVGDDAYSALNKPYHGTYLLYIELTVRPSLTGSNQECTRRELIIEGSCNWP